MWCTATISYEGCDGHHILNLKHSYWKDLMSGGSAPVQCCPMHTWTNQLYYDTFGWSAQLRRAAILNDYACNLFFENLDNLDNLAWQYDAKIHPNFISGLQKAWENFLFCAEIHLNMYKGSRIDNDCNPETGSGVWHTWEMGLWENYPRRHEVTQRQLELVEQGDGRWKDVHEWAAESLTCILNIPGGRPNERYGCKPSIEDLYELEGYDEITITAKQLNPSPWARCFMDHYNPRWDKMKPLPTLSVAFLQKIRDQEKAKLAADIRHTALKSPAFRKKTLKTATTPDSDEELVVASPHLTEADTDTGQPERNIIPYIAVGLLACGIIGGSIYFYYKKDNKKGRSK